MSSLVQRAANKHQPVDMEAVWRRVQRHQIIRERARLIRKGVIVPESRMKPQMMVRDADGAWRAEIKIVA